MNNIAKWLSIFSATVWTLPKPDNSIVIQASWATIWYQWYAGSSVLNIIKISNWWKDPLDTSTYYTYSVNSNSSKFQILWFLEDWSSSALSLSPDFAKSGLKSAFADPSSYSWRYVITKWDALWILLQSWSLVPLQANTTMTWVDIASTNTEYRIQLNNKDSITWTWGKLIIMKGINTIGQYDSSLLWYWDMETYLTGWLLADLSWNWNNATVSWVAAANWKNWKGLQFNSTSYANVWKLLWNISELSIHMIIKETSNTSNDMPVIFRDNNNTSTWAW
jgi:hypothetical protein